MITIIILLGKSCSGKDTTKKVLIDKYGFKFIPEYTTRPMRKGEIQGCDYNFIKDEKVFFNMINNLEMVTWVKFHMAGEKWVYYGFTYEQCNNSTKENVCITNIKNSQNLKKEEKQNKVNPNIRIYLKLSDEILLERLKQRGDNPKEAERRFNADKEDFKGIEENVDFIIDCDGKSPEEIAKEIYDFAQSC